RSRARLVHPICETASAHLRHDHISEQEIDCPAVVAANQLLSVIAIRSFEYFVTEAPQHAHGKMPHADVVLQHEDRLGAGWNFVRARFPVGWSGRRRDFRQKNSYSRAFSEFALHADVPAALAHSSVARPETESAAAF